MIRAETRSPNDMAKHVRSGKRSARVVLPTCLNKSTGERFKFESGWELDSITSEKFRLIFVEARKVAHIDLSSIAWVVSSWVCIIFSPRSRTASERKLFPGSGIDNAANCANEDAYLYNRRECTVRRNSNETALLLRRKVSTSRPALARGGVPTLGICAAI